MALTVLSRRLRGRGEELPHLPPTAGGDAAAAAQGKAPRAPTAQHPCHKHPPRPQFASPPFPAQPEAAGSSGRLRKLWCPV